MRCQGFAVYKLFVDVLEARRGDLDRACMRVSNEWEEGRKTSSKEGGKEGGKEGELNMRMHVSGKPYSAAWQQRSPRR